MKIKVLFLALSACFVSTAYAQDTESYPSKPITLIVSASPGGTTDLAARMIAEPLGKALGQTIVVENKPGAAGSIAAQQLIKSRADGYTLLLQYSGFQVITPSITKVNWDPVKDFKPVANVLSAPQVLVVKKNLPVNTLQELINYAKERPGVLNYASSGNGSLQHVTTELLNQMAGIDTVHVPYSGTGPALTDLIGGSVYFTITTPPPLLPHIQAGSLKPLVNTSNTKLKSLQDVPTASEAGLPDLLVSSWFAMYAPADTPNVIVNKLSSEIEKIMATPEYQEKAENLGATAEYMNSEQLGKYTEQELDRWKQVIESAKITSN